MKKQLSILQTFLVTCLLLVIGGGSSLAETKSGSWDLTKSSSDWTATGNVSYFSQPYGYKKVNGTLTNKNIEDFKVSGITEIKVGFKCLRNGATTSKLTIYLVDADGKPIGEGQEVTPENASSASSTTYQYATFTSNFTGATGFMMKVTTFGKNILINGAEYTVTYTPKTVSSIAISGTPTKKEYFVGESFDTNGLKVTATYDDASSADVTSNADFHCTPATFTSYGNVEVSVKATYKEVSSDVKKYPITVCLSKTIDLTKDETTTATTEEMTWVNDVVTIKSIRTSSGNTAANNYYPGTKDKTYTSTRFYTDNTLSFTPMNGNTIKFVVYEATSEKYATAMAKSSTWKNAKTSVSGTTVTITPKDGAEVFSATIGGATGGTSFKIGYTTEPVSTIITLPGKSGELYYGTYSNNNSNVKITVDSENIVEVSTVTVLEGQLLKTERTDGQVAKGEGVLICSTTPNVTVTNISTSVTKDAYNNLVATPFVASTDGEVGYKYYRMTYNNTAEESGLGFYWGAADGAAFDVAAEGKAILKVSEEESSGAKGFSFIWDDTNAIRDIEVAPVDSNAIYNMQGQRVNASAKGLLIKNGKKYISK